MPRRAVLRFPLAVAAALECAALCDARRQDREGAEAARRAAAILEAEAAEAARLAAEIAATEAATPAPQVGADTLAAGLPGES